MRGLVFLFFFLVSYGLGGFPSYGRPLVLAVLAKRGEEAALKRWRPLQEFLAQRTPYEIEIRPLPFERLKEAIQREEVDLVLANPAMYVQFEVCCGLSPLLTLKNLKFGRAYTRFGGVIFTRAETDLPSLIKSLKGRKFLVGAVNPDSFGGWLTQRWEFERAGLSLGRDFRVRFYGTHDAVVNAVKRGEVDLGCVRTDTLESMAAEGKIRLSEFRVLNLQKFEDFDLLVSTALYPEWPLARTPRLSREAAEIVASVLLSLKEDSPLAKLTEAAWTIPYNYQSVHDCLRDLGAPPYAAYKAKILREARARYLKFILGLLLLFFLATWVTIYILILHRRLAGLYRKLKAHNELLEELVHERTKHLEEERERLAVILGSLGEAVLVADVRGRLAMLNQAAERLLATSQDQVLGRPLCEVIHLEFSEKDSLREEEEVDKLAPLFFEEAHLKLPSGEEILVEGSAAPVQSKEGQVIGTVLVLRDITLRKHLEKETIRASQLETLRLVAGGVAHDFNNLLLSIAGYLELLRLRLSDSDLEEPICLAEQACFRARTLTRELLTYTTGGGPIKTRVHIADILRETASLALSGSKVKVSFELPDDLWETEVDADQIVICLQNILINARQAMSEGGEIFIKAHNQEIKPGQRNGLPPGPYLVLEIQDTGPGIPKDHLEKIFEPFFTTKEGGSGLGLFSCRRIMEAHGGLIEAESPGIGALIRIYLPACPRRSKEKPCPEKVKTISTGSRPARILLMDDEKGIRETLSEILSLYGYEVETAENGEEALEIFRRALKEGRAFDLVILDLTVPGGLGGKELLPRLRALDSSIRAILASGYSSDPVMGEYEAYGFQAALIKPFPPDELITSVERVLSL